MNINIVINGIKYIIDKDVAKYIKYLENRNKELQKERNRAVDDVSRLRWPDTTGQ